MATRLMPHLATAALLSLALMSCSKDPKPVVEPLGQNQVYTQTESSAGSDSSDSVSSSPNRTHGSVEILVQGKLGSSFRLKAQETNGAALTSLDGTITLTRIEVQPQVALQSVLLSYARAITVTSPYTTCVFSVKNFGSIQQGQSMIAFTLMGIDNNKTVAGDPSGCLHTLKQISQAGFEVRFDGADAQGASANVVLQVY